MQTTNLQGHLMKKSKILKAYILYIEAISIRLRKLDVELPADTIVDASSLTEADAIRFYADTISHRQLIITDSYIEVYFTSKGRQSVRRYPTPENPFSIGVAFMLANLHTPLRDFLKNTYKLKNQLSPQPSRFKIA